MVMLSSRCTNGFSSLQCSSGSEFINFGVALKMFKFMVTILGVETVEPLVTVEELTDVETTVAHVTSLEV